MRLLGILVILLAIAIVVLVAYLAAARRSAAEHAAAQRYRVVETTGDGQAHVLISRGTAESAVLIGSVALDDDDFHERYVELFVRAEDRVATLNASRELHADG